MRLGFSANAAPRVLRLLFLMVGKTICGRIERFWQDKQQCDRSGIKQEEGYNRLAAILSSAHETHTIEEGM